MTTAKRRPSVLTDADLSHVAPAPATPGPSSESVRQLADQAGFTNRQPSVEHTYAKALVEPPSRQPMVYRTGRTATFSVKTRPDAVDTFYRIAHARGWKAGETFERAMALLSKTEETA